MWLRRRQRPSATPSSDDPENPDNWIGLDYVHDAISAQFKQQFELWQDVNGRLRVILGVSGLVFAATLGLLPRGTVTVTTAAGPALQLILLPFWVGACAVGGVLLFFAAGIIATIAYWPRDFNWPPAPDSLYKYLTTNPKQIKLTVVDRMLVAYARNQMELARKVLAVRLSLAMSVIATGLLGTALIIDVVTYTKAWGS